MTTRFKREGPQRYHRTDPNYYIPFDDCRSETRPTVAAIWACVAVATVGITIILWVFK